MKLSARKLVHSTVMELPMTSMIDVVFLLLVFFMVTAAFIETERNLDSAIQVQQSAAESQSDLEPAVVEITESGGRYVYKLGAREMTSEAELLSVLEQFPAGARADGAFVRVSDGAPFSMAAAAIQTAKTAGFLVVTYVPNRE